ncbi:MAG TPA: ATP-binding protein [Spirochaetia bacterium]
MHGSLKALRGRPVMHYLSAVLATILAFAVREALALITGPDFPEYTVYYPTVLIVALLAGIRPAILASAVATGILLLQRFLPLPGFLGPDTGFSPVGLVFFTFVCLSVSFVAELYRQSRAKAAALDKELALRESQESLRHQAELLRLSFDAIIVWSPGGVIESWNRGAEELYGFTEAEAVGRNIHELLKTHHPAPWDVFESELRKEGQWDGEIRHVTRGGQEVVVSSRQHLGSGHDGRLRILQIDRDITEQKRVQAELQRAHDELEGKVLQRTSDLKKANRTLLMVSQCDQAIVQISDVRELVAVICQIIRDEAEFPLVWAGFLDTGGALGRVAAAADRDEWGVDALVEGPAKRAIRAGAPLVVDTASADDYPGFPQMAAAQGFTTAASFPLLDAHGTAFGALVICVESGFEPGQTALLKELVDDLAFGIMSLRARTERDQAQAALERTASQLRIMAGELVRAEHRERQRIAQLLHDQFQQLLVAALYGVASFKGPAEEVARVTQLLRDCIAMSRSLTSELGHPALAEPDMRVGLEWLASWMKEKHNLDVELLMPPSMVLPIEEVRGTLLQAARELLFNVVKHSRATSATVVAEHDPDGTVRITVSDNGIGFDPRDHDERTTDAKAGIGLFSIRERLALTGGGLDVQSAPGGGTSVTVWAPGVREPHTAGVS